MSLYLKALHIIFVVTWFAGLFYFPRLLIYNTEANDKTAAIKDALQQQFAIMMKRLWYGITWPSAALTLVFGLWILIKGGWYKILFEPAGSWLMIKLGFVLLLYLYHFSLHRIFLQQLKGIFFFTSQQLRLWNEVVTIFLIAIVMLVVVREKMSVVWGLAGLVLFIILLMSVIKIYKLLRK
jgi:putative membrane protein